MNNRMNQLHLNTSNNFKNSNKKYHQKKLSYMNSYTNQSDLNTISENKSKYTKLRISLPLQGIKSKMITSKLGNKTIETSNSPIAKFKKQIQKYNNNSIYYSKHKNKTTFINSYLTSEIKLDDNKKNLNNNIENKNKNKNKTSLIKINLNLNDEEKENRVNNNQYKVKNISVHNQLNTELKSNQIKDNKMSNFIYKIQPSIKKLIKFQSTNNSFNLNNNNNSNLKGNILENSKNNYSIEKKQYKKYNNTSLSNITYLTINNPSKKESNSKNKEIFISPRKLLLTNEKSEKKLEKSTTDNNNKKRLLQIIKEEGKKKEIPKIINPNEFKIIKQIGCGSFGKIYKTTWNKDGEKYAMKIICTRSKDNLLYIKEKVNLIKNFEEKTKCEGLIKIYGDTYIIKGNDYYYYEIMELAEKDWEQEIKIRKNNLLYYTEYELFSIMSQLIKTLSLLQKYHITHRDIKLQNILLLNKKYKICDFGESRKLVQKGVIVQPARGSELYMSPLQFFALNEKLKQVQHNAYKSDVFSLGMCILFAATLSDDCLYDIREITDMNIIINILERYLSRRYSKRFIQLLLCFLEIDEKKRPDFIILENIISHIKIDE